MVVVVSLCGITNLLNMCVITFKAGVSVSWKLYFIITVLGAIGSYFCFITSCFYFPTLTGDETLRGLSIRAAQRALEMAQVKAEDVDLVLLCTSTPDDLFGGAAQVSCDTF